MITLNEYDERQLNLMLNRLNYFENIKLDLSSLVGRLEGLLRAMEYVSDEWEENFLDEFSVLESIHAEVPKLKNQEIDKVIINSIYNLKND